MELNIQNIKYSIFGNYDFLEANQDNVSKLYKILGQDGFLPNMIQMIQIEQPTNKVTKKSRPQFICEEKKCSIIFLPDRIDIEIKEGGSLEFCSAIGYLGKIIEAFELKIYRIALNSTAVSKITSKEEGEGIWKKIIAGQSYPFCENTIEWGTKNVARMECAGLGENVNIGQNIESIAVAEHGNVEVKGIQVKIDINTLGENMEDRFSIESCKVFFKEALKWKEDIINNLKGIH